MADSKSILLEMKTGRPEDELLLWCTRVFRTTEDDRRIGALLREEIDWEYLLQVAREHRVASLLFWYLNTTCPEAVPQAVLDRLREQFHDNNRRSLFLTGKLLMLLNAFEAHGILAIPYKGPVLAAFAYGNLALRVFTDLDFLVHKQDVVRTRELLVSLGYRPEYQLTRAQEAAFLRSQGEYSFVHEGDGSILDLHWEITEKHFSFPPDPECLWERLERVSLGGSTVSTFSPEDLLLILCVHGSKHLWERLGWTCNVAELTRVHRGMKWEQILKQASTLGSERMLFLGFFLAGDLLEADLPEEVLQRIQADPRVKVLAGQMYERLFRKDDERLRAFEEVTLHPLHPPMRERWRDRVRYCVRAAMTLTPRDWKLLPLPRQLFPSYYVLRPVRLAGEYEQRLLKRTP